MSLRFSNLLAPSLLAAALVGCGEKDAEQDTQQAFEVTPTAQPPAIETDPHTGQGLPGFFTPRPGETWTYTVHRDVPPQSVLNDDDQLRSTDLPGGGYRFELERQRVCLGTQTPEGSDAELTVLELSEDGLVIGQEYLDIGADGMIAKAWKPAGNPTTKVHLLTPGVLLASPQMAGGQIWTSKGADTDQEFQFRVLERTTIEVPAGSYEAARLQMNSGSDSRAVRRTLWFAENVGIVKEEIIYYDESKITMRESAELTSWSAPEDREPEKEEEVMDDDLQQDPLDVIIDHSKTPVDEGQPDELEELSLLDSLELIAEQAMDPFPEDEVTDETPSDEDS